MPISRAESKTVFVLVAALLASFLPASAAPKGASAKPASKSPAKSAAKSAAPALAAAAPVPAKPLLDSAAIRKLYLDGDFEQAIEMLENGLKERRPFAHGDSVFIFKHLGVMYAAKYETREKGKYYMHQLLMAEPTARIMDMYASDMIYMIFKNIQDEFESSRMKLDRAESHLTGNRADRPAREPEPRQDPKASNGHAAVYWIGAGAVAAVGVASYFIFVDEPKTTTTTNKHNVP